MPAEVLLINPTKRKRRRKTVVKKKSKPSTGGKKTMARKAKRHRRTGIVAVPRIRRRSASYRKNPASRSRRGGDVLSLGFGNIGKDILPLSMGALGASLASKHLDNDPTTGGSTQPWGIWNYVLAFLGSYATGVVLSMLPIFGDRKHARTQAVNGGLALIVYNLVTKQWAARSETVANMFGDTSAVSASDQSWRFMKPGQVWRGQDGVNYRLMGDMSWKPIPRLTTATIGDIVDSDRYGDIVDADRYSGTEETPVEDGSWSNTRPPMADPYYMQYYG